MTKILRQTRVSPPHLHKRDKIDVPNAVVGILSCQTFVRSRSDPVALSPSTQIAPAHGEEQMFVLARQDSAAYLCRVNERVFYALHASSKDTLACLL